MSRVLILLLAWVVCAGGTFAAPVLKGKVHQLDGAVRVKRPTPPVLRPTTSRTAAQAGRFNALVDIADFDFAKRMAREAPIAGDTTGGAGEPEPAAASKTIDARAEENDLVIAWEAWHKRVCSALYQNWLRHSSIVGTARTTIRVTRDRRITVSVDEIEISPFQLVRGNHEYLQSAFERDIKATVEPLDGSMLLDFPEKSRRGEATLTPNFAKSAGRAGYDWRRDDYERVSGQ